MINHQKEIVCDQCAKTVVIKLDKYNDGAYPDSWFQLEISIMGGKQIPKINGLYDICSDTCAKAKLRQLAGT